MAEETLLAAAAKSLQWDHTRATQGVDRQWQDVPDNERRMWLAMARRVLRKVGDALGRLTIAPSSVPSEPHIAPRERLPDAASLVYHPLSASKTAAALGVTVRTIARHVAKGMPHVRTPGGQMRFNMNEVENWLASRRASRAVEEAKNPSPMSPQEIAEAYRHGREIAERLRLSALQRAEKAAAKAAGKPWPSRSEMQRRGRAIANKMNRRDDHKKR